MKRRTHIRVTAAYDPGETYYDFDPNNPIPLVEVLRRWAADGTRPHGWSKHVVYYPMSEVWALREYGWTRETARMSLDDWDALVESMKRGWKRTHPAHVEFGKNGKAKVGEGNHRLAVARGLGMKKVPVSFGNFTGNVSVNPAMRSPAGMQKLKKEMERKAKEKQEREQKERKQKEHRTSEDKERWEKLTQEERKEREEQVDRLMDILF